MIKFYFFYIYEIVFLVPFPWSSSTQSIFCFSTLKIIDVYKIMNTRLGSIKIYDILHNC